MKSVAFNCRLTVQFSACLVMGILLTGCAFSRTQVKVNFSPNVMQPLSGAHKGSLEVGEVKDSRFVTDSLVLLQKANQYGATSGAYVADVPVADTFRDGLRRALEQNGFTGTNADHYILRSELHGFGIGVIQTGLFSAATAKPWLEVRFELDNKETGQPVWHDTYTGQVTDQLSAWNGADADRIARFFSLAATDVVKQLIADRAFRSIFGQ